MMERGIQDVRSYRRLRQRQQVLLVLTVLFIMGMTVCFMCGVLVGTSWQLKRAGKTMDSEKSVIDIGGTIADSVSENAWEFDAMPIADSWESGADTNAVQTDEQWNLMLVNKWNPIPEHYEGDLVELDGGERVDTRIYEPLLQMLEDAKEAN